MSKKHKLRSLIPSNPKAEFEGIEMKGAIPRPNLKNDETLMFHFKYIDHQHSKYSHNNPDKNFWKKLIDRFRNMETMTIPELLQAGKSTRFHIIDWEQTSEKKGFSHLKLGTQFTDAPHYQFEVSQGCGRVHGILVGNHYYVVWFDPDHRVYGK